AVHSVVTLYVRDSIAVRRSAPGVVAAVQDVSLFLAPSGAATRTRRGGAGGHRRRAHAGRADCVGRPSLPAREYGWSRRAALHEYGLWMWWAQKESLMNLVVAFEQADLGLTSLVGGKGHNLVLLTAAGFPVPPGFVLTAEAYGLFL